jgi:hypothetical protein
VHIPEMSLLMCRKDLPNVLALDGVNQCPLLIFTKENDMLKSIARWAKRRLDEGTTYAGIITVAAPIIAQKMGLPLDVTTQILTQVVGGIMIGATTKNHPPFEEQI